MKYIKYLVFSFIIFCFLIPVFAESVLIKGVTLKEVSGDVVVGDTLIDGDTIQPDIVFYDEGDSVSYQIDLNYDTNLYLIDSIKDNNENDFIKTNYSYKEDKVFMTIFYDEKVSSSFELEPINLKISLKEKAVNPKTGYSDWIILLFVCFVLLTFFYSLIRYRKILIIFVFLIPMIVFAKDNNIFEITINTENIRVSYTVHFHKSDDIDGEMEDISCVPGEDCTLPEVTFQKDGNFFVGWALSIDGESVYLDQENVENFMELLENNEVTLYPLWAPTINNFDYTGAVQTYVVPKNGRYKLEVWGAQGGDGNEYKTSFLGGKGGYSVGQVTLNHKLELFIYVGGQGKSLTNVSGQTIIGGFNGGGNNRSTTSWSVGSGGGGTDIRVGSDSLYSRVIVAGGGGSSSSRNDNQYGGSGGDGGGTSGTRKDDHINSGYQSGFAGTSSSGGSGYESNSSGSSYVLNGFFGNGAGYSGKGAVNGGGGGGWYGGGSGYCAGSGGGSGYVYTESTASYYPSGCLLNSSYYLTDAETIAGDQSFPSPSGGTETGHSGNGYVRITYIGS